MNRTALSRIERLNYILGAALAAATLVFRANDEALGVLVGVVIACVNFSVLRKVVERWFTHAAEGRNAAGFLLLPKMMVLLAAVVCALAFLPISAPWFALGFSIFVVSIAIETARALIMPAGESSTSIDEAGENG